jgi:hypothetical protein
MGPIFQRALRAARFDKGVFDDVRWDGNATADAVVLVAVVSLAVLLGVFLGQGFRAATFVTAALNVMISNVAGWLLLAVATWFAASRLFKPQGDYWRRFEQTQAVMRVHGIAYLPMILGAFVEFSPILAGVGSIWYFAAAGVGTAQVMDLKLREGLAAVLIGAAIMFVLRLILGYSFGFFSAFG